MTVILSKDCQCWQAPYSCSPTTSLKIASNIKNKKKKKKDCQHLLERSLCTWLATWFLWLPPRGCTPDHLDDCQWGLVSQFQQNSSKQKQQLLTGYLPLPPSQGSAQKEQTETPISQSPLKEVYLHTLKAEGLASNQQASVWPEGPASNQPASRCWQSSFIWDTVRSWHALNYWEPLRTKKPASTIKRFERQPRASARLNNKFHPLHETTSRLGEVAVYQMHRNQHIESRKMKKQKNMFQTKVQDKTPEKDLSETEVSEWPDKKLKIMFIKILTKVRKAIHEQSENFNKEIENTR